MKIEIICAENQNEDKTKESKTGKDLDNQESVKGI